MKNTIKARFTNNLNKPRNAVFVVFQDKHGFQYAYNKSGEYAYLTRGDANKLLSISKIKKFDICECLRNVTFNMKSVNAFQELVVDENGDKLVVSFTKTGFDCCGHQNRCLGTFDCIKQMRSGKCHYAFARGLFPDAYSEKQK